MAVCSRCNIEYDEKSGINIDVTNEDDVDHHICLCSLCVHKLKTFLTKNDYECLKDMLIKPGYEKDVDFDDDDEVIILSTYGNKVAIEFEGGEFLKITEAC